MAREVQAARWQEKYRLQDGKRSTGCKMAREVQVALRVVADGCLIERGRKWPPVPDHAVPDLRSQTCIHPKQIYDKNYLCKTCKTTIVSVVMWI
jgi:hypothetical protein